MKKCITCGEYFKPNRSQKTCSPKCRLLSHVKKQGDCWEWTGCLSKSGYGQLTLTSGKVRAHRHSYEIFKGNIPEGKLVCHNCPGKDNKKCVNPDHLWLGTIKENCQDAKNKGYYFEKGSTGKKWSDETRKKMKMRQPIGQKGSKNNASKLNEFQVKEIKEMIDKGMGNTEISIKYNVSSACIYEIRRGKNWSHI